ncbi:MAG: hemerythrin domain-containing protein [Acidobacteriota bacterium]
MGIQIGAKPDAGFDDPLGMLKDCHRRIERFLGVLCLVAERARGRAMTDEESAAVQAALSYFRAGGQRHTRDEEDSLFPRMRAAGIDPAEIERVGGLEHDHQVADNLHSEADRLFTEWLEKSRLPAEEETALLHGTEQLKALYAKHIDVEEKQVFPCAAEHLDKTALAAMGQEFRARRATS